jgi:hypothetical protein
MGLLEQFIKAVTGEEYQIFKSSLSAQQKEDAVVKVNSISSSAGGIDDTVILRNKAWRSNTCIPVIEDTAKKAANAILKIVGYGFSQAEITANDYRVSALSRKDGTYGLMITIYDNSTYYSYYILQAGTYPTDSLTGPLWYKTNLKDGKYFDILIDFSLLEDGFKFTI